MTDETHDASALSWVASANAVDNEFPLQNLPFGVFVTAAEREPHIGVRIGDCVLDLHKALDARLFSVDAHEESALRQRTLNAWMALGKRSSSALRRTLFALLHMRTAGLVRDRLSACVVPVSDCEMQLPTVIGDFTDFYTSIHHARRASEVVRGNASLNPNFRSIPIAYHGRSSSVAISGVSCHRPYGVVGDAGGYRPSKKLDFELEVGFYVGSHAETKKPFDVDAAEDHLFGFCIVNDWSARDLQRWESAPLGPFLAKSFMTSVSAWVVTAEALAPFRAKPAARGDDAPAPAAELASAAHAQSGAIDIALCAVVQSRAMRAAGIAGIALGKPNFKDQYWSPAQMLAHHASNGCPLRSGDLISSGTVSGPDRNDSGCLLERTMDGNEPLMLPTGEMRAYLEDGDAVTFSGYCSRDGFRSIGFGECTAEVVGAAG